MNLVFCVPESLHGNGMSFLGIAGDTLTWHPIKLSEGFNQKLPFIQGPCVVFNKRLFDKYYPNVESYDFLIQYWLNYGDIKHREVEFSLLDLYREFHFFYQRDDMFRFIPYVKHIEKAMRFFTRVKDYPKIMQISSASIFYREKVFPAFYNLESNGIKVRGADRIGVFQEYKGDYIYPEYNFTTSTGRPSSLTQGNQGNKINLLALNKGDDSRKNLVTRFPKGLLAEFDFEAFHLRLISFLIKYDFPEDIHTFLGKQYFLKSTLNPEEYVEAKKLTFRFLYGDVTDEMLRIPFFQKVQQYRISLWKKYVSGQPIVLPHSKREIRSDIANITYSKLFNYYIQGVEFETSVLFLDKIVSFLAPLKSKVVLYLYDSFLFDLSLEDDLPVSAILVELKKILPFTRIKKGQDYYDII